VEKPDSDWRRDLERLFTPGVQASAR
jgi:hypothetical protein